MNNEFIPKKGMVFFLEEPQKSQWFDNDTVYQKNRPYLVVSNDSVNEYGVCVQLVPITTKPPKSGSRWWAVPLKRSNGTCNWVNVLQCICVPKTLCTQANHSESFARDVEHNEEFLQRVNDALAQYFGIKVPEETKVPETVPTTPNVEINAGTQSVTIPITLSLTLDVKTLLSSIHETVKLPAEQPEPVVEPIVAPMVEEKPTLEEPKKRTRPVFNDEQKKKIFAVCSQCKALGGKLSIESAAEQVGVSISTISRYIKKLADGRFNSVTLTPFEIKTLLKHLENCSMESAYKFWKHKGFTSIEQFMEYCNYIRNK